MHDLLFHFPLRHQAFAPATPIAELFFQAEGSVLGTLERVEVENLPRGLKRLKATVKALAPRQVRRGALKAVKRHVVYGGPPPPDDAFMAELRQRCKPEVVRLSEYLDRDLVTLWGYDDVP